jgi:OOP family OmpA-OmpF porin
MTLFALLSLAGTARAAGYSTDIELVRPTFSPGAVQGMDSAGFGRPGTVRAGTLIQYERDPLLLYEVDREAGAVIHNRAMAHLGVSVDLTKRFSARFVLPIGGQWGTQVDDLAADTGGLGDMSLGGRMHLFTLGPLDLAARADILLPFGTHAAYLGEQSPRGVGGVLIQAKFGPLALLGDVSATGRGNVETEQDFELGSELGLNGGVQLDVWPDNVAIGASVLSRSGFEHLFQGGAENPVELVANLQLRPARDWRLDLGVGRGLASGYGTTQFRALAGLTFQRTPPLPPEAEPTPLTRLSVTEAPDLPPDVDVEVTPVVIEGPKWKPDELARVEESQIVIRDPIQFELATDHILPESIPTLHAISALLTEHPEIAHVVIEGHASEEGSYPYNYDLSIRRSLAIFRELVVAGTYPGRLSCRGMGEVEPVAQGTDEAALAANRRVIFHIIKRLKPGDTQPTIRTEMQLPWDGSDAKFAQPPPIPAPEPEPAPKAAPKKPEDYPTDPNLFKEGDEDDDDDDTTKDGGEKPK